MRQFFRVAELFTIIAFVGCVFMLGAFTSAYAASQQTTHSPSKSISSQVCGIVLVSPMQQVVAVNQSAKLQIVTGCTFYVQVSWNDGTSSQYPCSGIAGCTLNVEHMYRQVGIYYPVIQAGQSSGLPLVEIRVV